MEVWKRWCENIWIFICKNAKAYICLSIHSNIYTYKCGFAATQLHSHKSRQFQAMRGNIIPTCLKIWVDRRRHAIFVVEFQPPQIPPMELLRKGHRTCACWNLLPATYLILLNQHIHPSAYAVTFSWWVLEWLTAICSKGYAVQNEPCTHHPDFNSKLGQPEVCRCGSVKWNSQDVC